MAYTQEDEDRLKAAIASGRLTVQFRDRRVTYRSLQEMREALRMIHREVHGGRPRRRFVRFGRDLQ